MATREVYSVQVTRPDWVTVEDMKKYIQEAVEIWSKGGNPEAPLWMVSDHPVKVHRLKQLHKVPVT